MSPRWGTNSLLLVVSLTFVPGMGCPKDGDCIPGPSTYCGDDDDHTPVEPVCGDDDPSVAGLSIPFETLACSAPVIGDDEPIDDDENWNIQPVGATLRTQEELDTYLAEHFGQQYHDCSVDLAQEMILATHVFVGCADCERLEICGAYDEGDRLEVSVHNYHIDGHSIADCCFHAYHLVKIDRTDRPVDFVFHDVMVDHEHW